MSAMDGICAAIKINCARVGKSLDIVSRVVAKLIFLRTYLSLPKFQPSAATFPAMLIRINSDLAAPKTSGTVLDICKAAHQRFLADRLQLGRRRPTPEVARPATTWRW